MRAAQRAEARRTLIAGLPEPDRVAVAATAKVELHVHLEGSIQPATMLMLAERNRIDLGFSDAGALAAGYEFDGFDEFARLYMLGLSVLQGGEDFALVIGELVRELAAQHVVHAEVTTTPWSYIGRGVDADEYTQALDAGRRTAAEQGLSIVWICDLARGFEPPPYELTMDYVLGSQAPEGLVALGLSGREAGNPAAEFAACFERARAAGLHCCAHAGEAAGPESVRAAIELGAERIGHGIRAIEDRGLVDELARSALPIEVCPTSNVALHVVERYGEHQLPEMIASGLNVSISSDDPAYFSTTLTGELELAMALAGLSVPDIADIQRKALAAAFVSGDERRRLERALNSP